MKIKNFVQVIFIFIILGFLLLNVYKNWNVITNFNWNISIENFLPIIFLLIPLYIINATSWYLLTKALGFNLPYLKTINIWLYSNIARFIPGAIWQYIGRVYMMNKEGVAREKVITALGLEAIFNLVTGFFVVLLTISFWKLPVQLDQMQITILSILGSVLLLVILSNQKILIYIMNLINKISGRKQKITYVLLPLKWIPVLIFSYFLQFLFAGVLLFFWVNVVSDLPLNMALSFVGIFAFSWLMGYIAIFSPSGLGVQELSIAGLLSFYIPFPVASLIAILFRLSIIISEICTVLILYIFKKVL